MIFHGSFEGGNFPAVSAANVGVGQLSSSGDAFAQQFEALPTDRNDGNQDLGPSIPQQLLTPRWSLSVWLRIFGPRTTEL